MGLARSHWVWLAAILTVWSAWDWYEHIARPGSAFEQAPGAWFGFTFASLASVLGIARGTAFGLERAHVPELAASALGAAIGVAAHLLVIGPLWDRVFWDAGLRFNAVAVPALVAAGLYLAFRALFALLSRIAGLRSSSQA